MLINSIQITSIKYNCKFKIFKTGLLKFIDIYDSLKGIDYISIVILKTLNLIIIIILGKIPQIDNRTDLISYIWKFVLTRNSRGTEINWYSGFSLFTRKQSKCWYYICESSWTTTMQSYCLSSEWSWIHFYLYKIFNNNVCFICLICTYYIAEVYQHHA